MKCYILEVKKGQLDTLPREEVAFLTVILHLANEINMLQKAALASKPGARLLDSIVDSAQNCQALFFMKILAGKLYEGWRTLEKGYFATRLSQKYGPILPELSRNALARLKKYFGNPKNLVKVVRHKYAFHTDLDRIIDSLANLPASERVSIAITDSLGNIYAQFAEEVTNWSLVNAINADDLDNAIEKLMAQTFYALPKDFLHFSHGFAEAVLSQLDPIRTEHELKGATLIDEAYLPYFAEQE